MKTLNVLKVLNVLATIIFVSIFSTAQAYEVISLDSAQVYPTCEVSDNLNGRLRMTNHGFGNAEDEFVVFMRPASAHNAQGCRASGNLLRVDEMGEPKQHNSCGNIITRAMYVEKGSVGNCADCVFADPQPTVHYVQQPVQYQQPPVQVARAPIPLRQVARPAYLGTSEATIWRGQNMAFAGQVAQGALTFLGMREMAQAQRAASSGHSHGGGNHHQGGGNSDDHTSGGGGNWNNDSGTADNYGDGGQFNDNHGHVGDAPNGTTVVVDDHTNWNDGGSNSSSSSGGSWNWVDNNSVQNTGGWIGDNGSSSVASNHNDGHSTWGD